MNVRTPIGTEERVQVPYDPFGYTLIIENIIPCDD
jgi:hypothetical protein